jgi:hypothetical protein
MKLQKAIWTDDDMRSVPNHCGVFFSIWLDAKSLGKNQTNYNIHALKMRQLSRYRVKSRDFARAFRTKFHRGSRAWPNVSTDFGPQTLMQGWIGNEPETYEANVLNLMRRFRLLSPVIDQLLLGLYGERVADRGTK